MDCVAPFSKMLMYVGFPLYSIYYVLSVFMYLCSPLLHMTVMWTHHIYKRKVTEKYLPNWGVLAPSPSFSTESSIKFHRGVLLFWNTYYNRQQKKWRWRYINVGYEQENNSNIENTTDYNNKHYDKNWIEHESTLLEQLRSWEWQWGLWAGEYLRLHGNLGQPP